MKKKIGLFFLFIVFGTLIWYLFIKPYDYLVTFKAKTFPGTINQTIKLWSKLVDPASKITQSDLQDISQELTINDTTYHYKWKLYALNDSTTRIKVFVKDVDHSLSNKLKIPFFKTDFEKTTKNILVDFNEKLTDHLKKFKINIIGKDTFSGKYCVYIPIKSTQLQKAKGMMKNTSLLESFILSNNIELNGLPRIEVTNWDMETDSIYYNFCYPIVKNDSLPDHKLIRYKQIESTMAIKAIYNGNYITSDRAWYSLLDYAAKNNISIEKKPFEIFYNNPNMGSDEINWKAEVFIPIN